MKLLICLDCMDVFSLTTKEKICGCGKTKGHYTDNLNAVYSGNAQPIGFANSKFRYALMIQKIEDEKNVGKGNGCCEGVEFTAFFIPANATSIEKIDE